MTRIINDYFYCCCNPYKREFGKWYVKEPYSKREQAWVLDDINRDIFFNGVSYRVTRESLDELLACIFDEWLMSQVSLLHLKWKYRR